MKSVYSAWKNSRTKAVVDVVSQFKGTTPSLVYAPGPGTAQNWAVEYSGSLDGSTTTLSTDVRDLINFVSESIHPQCSLIGCLKSRVAYHHSKLTDFVREEIESLFADSKLDVLFCTSTLLQGVNLPAEKIFVVAAQKADEDLTQFEFKNLIGRAGRLSQHLCGLVYCIQVPTDAEDDWIDSFRGQPDKGVEPVVSNRLKTNFELLLKAIQNGEPSTSLEPVVRSATIILRSRYLASEGDFKRYLKRKQLSDQQGSDLEVALREFAAQLTIPAAIVLKNPYVDPVLQNKLFIEVSADPSKWQIRRTKGFSTDFDEVFKLLDEIFGIIREIDPRGVHEYHRNDVTAFAKMWLNGKSFRDIVVRALPSSLRRMPTLEQKEVDKAINRAMDLVSHDVAFVTAKYFSVLSEVLRTVVSEDDLDSYAWTIALPVMLELGCGDSKSLALAMACVPRAAALKIAPIIPDDAQDPILWLTLNESDPRLQSLQAIYKRILKRTGIWATDSNNNSL